MEEKLSTKTLTKEQSAITTVMKILDVEKVNWPAAVKACHQALEDGFTLDDFVMAAQAMMLSDPAYHSVLSVFVKTEYWLSQYKTSNVNKGVW